MFMYSVPFVDVQASVVDPLLNMHLPAFDRLLMDINGLSDGEGPCTAREVHVWCVICAAVDAGYMLLAVFGSVTQSSHSDY